MDFELKELEGIEKLGEKWKIILDDDGERRVLTDKLELVILEIPKARRIIKKRRIIMRDEKSAQRYFREQGRV